MTATLCKQSSVQQQETCNKSPPLLTPCVTLSLSHSHSLTLLQPTTPPYLQRFKRQVVDGDKPSPKQLVLKSVTKVVGVVFCCASSAVL